MTTGRVYADFDELIQRVELYISTKKFSLYRCIPDQVRKRVIQKIVELTSESFSHHALSHGDTGIRSHAKLKLNEVSIKTSSGEVSVSAKLLLVHVSLFLAEWGRILWILSASFFTARAIYPKATILAEAGGDYLNDDAHLVEFCRKGPVLPLSKGLLIIGSNNAPRIQRDRHIVYTKTPYIESAIRTTDFGERVVLICWHLLCPLIILNALFFNKLLLFIGKDIASLLMITYLDRKMKLDDVLVTTSAFAAQPIWMKGLHDQVFKLNMIWYSQNFIPKAYLGETERPNLPSARHMRVDVHWVWTEGFKEYLIELGQSSHIFVVGPLLWYLDSATLPDTHDEKYYRIAIFDINPLPDDKKPFGAFKNYYSTSMMRRFITDILDLKITIENNTGKKAEFLLKHKRVPHWTHDSSYFSFLQELVQEQTGLELVNPHENLFELIRKTDLSIAVPYTSTCYVSSFIKIQAVYYDPFAELVPFFEQDPFVFFASGPDELKGLLIGVSSASSN